jgi:ribosomal protein S3
MNNRNFNATLLTYYLTKKLGQYYTITEILNPMMKDLKVNPYILGFRIKVVGRLTRAERASFSVHSHGPIPLSSTSAKIDYAIDTRNLRFGMVAIKMWLLKSDLAKSHYYFYSFLY